MPVTAHDDQVGGYPAGLVEKDLAEHALAALKHTDLDLRSMPIKVLRNVGFGLTTLGASRRFGLDQRQASSGGHSDERQSFGNRARGFPRVAPSDENAPDCARGASSRRHNEDASTTLKQHRLKQAIPAGITVLSVGSAQDEKISPARL